MTTLDPTTILEIGTHMCVYISIYRRPDYPVKVHHPISPFALINLHHPTARVTQSLSNPLTSFVLYFLEKRDK